MRKNIFSVSPGILKMLFLSVLLLCSNVLMAQVSVIGSEDYGRLDQIVYDPFIPDKVYGVPVGSNHLMVSSDNGAHWSVLYAVPTLKTTSDEYATAEIQHLRTTPDKKYLSFVEYRPNTDGTMLVILDPATGQIHKRYELPNADGGAWITSYSIAPSNPDVIMIATSREDPDIDLVDEVYYTADNGGNWAKVYADYEDGQYISVADVAISPANPQKLFMARSEGRKADGGLLVSEDGGKTWTEQFKGIEFGVLAFNPSDANDILLGTGYTYDPDPEALYHSTDGGATWTAQNIKWQQGLSNNILSITYNPNDNKNIIVLEENQVIITKDGGKTWQTHDYDPRGKDTYSYYYGYGASFNPFRNGEIFIVSNYYPFFSTDGGETLTRFHNPFFAASGNIGIVDNGTDRQLYYGVQDGYILRNLNDGTEKAFGVQPLNLVGGDSPSLFVDDRIAGRQFTYNQNMDGYTLNVSSDYGSTRTALYSTWNDLLKLAIDPHNHQVVLAAFSVSDDEGYINNSELLKIDFSDTAHVEQTPLQLPAKGIVGDICFDPKADGHFFVSIYESVYETVDWGKNWTKRTDGLEDLDPDNDAVLAMAINPFDGKQLALATSKGIYTSADGAKTWNKSYDTLMQNIAFSPVTNGHIVASTRSTDKTVPAITCSSDGGKTWADVSNEELQYISAPETAFHFAADSCDVYYATPDLGLVSHTIHFDKASGIHTVNSGSLNVRNLPEQGTNVEVYDICGKL